MGGGVGCRSGHNTQEAAEELRDLAGDATYRQLLERHPDVTNSLGALLAAQVGGRVRNSRGGAVRDSR